MRIQMILPVIMLSSLHAESVTQTDWSGGDGEQGPVAYWTDVFDSCYQVDWFEYPENLRLSKVPSQSCVKHGISDSLSFNGLSIADMNNDGLDDVLMCAGQPNNTIGWFERSFEDSVSWTLHVADTSFRNARNVSAADIDGDFDLDIIAGGIYVNEVCWWENDDGFGLVWDKHQISDEVTEVTGVCAADINGDAFPDVIGVQWTQDGILWFENPGDTDKDWIPHIIGYMSDPYSSHSDDVDGDGDMDVMTASDGGIAWWENVDSAGNEWVKHTAGGALMDGARDVISGDIDSDGDVDIAGAAQPCSNIYWWENVDGSGLNLEAHAIDNSAYGARSLDLIDMDGDGDLDLPALGSPTPYTGYVWWYENADGSGGGWEKHYVDNLHYSDLTGMDVDIDGDMDLIAAGYYGAWWEVFQNVAEGNLTSSILDTGCDPQWASLCWNSTVPESTALLFRYRTSDSPSAMGDWSDPLYNPCILSGNLDRFFQYRLELMSSDVFGTPVLHDITLSWDPVGIGHSPDAVPVGSGILRVLQNPSSAPVLGFELQESGSVELMIFDLSGRMIMDTGQVIYSSGYHEVTLDGFVPGVYICRMKTGTKAFSRLLMVIE